MFSFRLAVKIGVTDLINSSDLELFSSSTNENEINNACVPT